MKAGRPKKVRYIQQMPKTVLFSPRGNPGRPDEVELTIEQFEAIKLADHQGCSQEQGATAMKISRAAFGRILRDARKRLADAIVNGKALRIRMGQAQIGVRRRDVSLEDLRKEVAQFKQRNQELLKVLSLEKKPGEEESGSISIERARSFSG